MTDSVVPLGIMNTSLSACAMPAVKKEADKVALEKASQDFESLFVNYMLQQMRNTIPEQSLFGGGQAEKIYTSLLDTELSKTISQEHSIGLANLIYTQMLALENKSAKEAVSNSKK
jgi:Rod binding domain-containing protein